MNMFCFTVFFFIFVIAKYEPSILAADILKKLCSSEATYQVCLCRDDVTTTLLMPVARWIDSTVSVSLPYTTWWLDTPLPYTTVLMKNVKLFICHDRCGPSCLNNYFHSYKGNFMRHVPYHEGFHSIIKIMADISAGQRRGMMWQCSPSNMVYMTTPFWCDILTFVVRDFVLLWWQ